MKITFPAIVLMLPLVAVLAGCEQEGPAERAGERIDEAVEDAGEQIEEAGDKVRESTE